MSQDYYIFTHVLVQPSGIEKSRVVLPITGNRG